jgi:hypothetical protein
MEQSARESGDTPLLTLPRLTTEQPHASNLFADLEEILAKKRVNPKEKLLDDAPGITLDEDEVQHMLFFFLCLLRDQCKLMLTPHDLHNFDQELSRFDTEFGGKDVMSMSRVMGFYKESLDGRNGWMPYHPALGNNELYMFAMRGRLTPKADNDTANFATSSPSDPPAPSLVQSVPRLPSPEVRQLLQRASQIRHLATRGIINEKEVFAIHFAFRASSHMPLFDTLILALFLAEGADTIGHPAHRRWKEALWEPQKAFERHGSIHQSFREYRSTGHKLHTSCYRCSVYSTYCSILY